MYTTLNKLRNHSPCGTGWHKLLSHLKKTQADDEPLSYLTILDSNGTKDVLWCLSVEEREREFNLYTAWCMSEMRELTDRSDLVTAIEAAQRFVNGSITVDELRSEFFDLGHPSGSNDDLTGLVALITRYVVWIIAFKKRDFLSVMDNSCIRAKLLHAQLNSQPQTYETICATHENQLRKILNQAN